MRKFLFRFIVTVLCLVELLAACYALSDALGSNDSKLKIASLFALFYIYIILYSIYRDNDDFGTGFSK